MLSFHIIFIFKKRLEGAFNLPISFQVQLHCVDLITRSVVLIMAVLYPEPDTAGAGGAPDTGAQHSDDKTYKVVPHYIDEIYLVCHYNLASARTS